MNLTLKERMAILTVLPKTGSFVELMFIQQIIDTLKITTEESVEYDIQNVKIDENTRTVLWNDKGNTDVKDFVIIKGQMDVLHETFTKLSDDKKLTMDHFSVAKKIFDVTKEAQFDGNTTQ